MNINTKRKKPKPRPTYKWVKPDYQDVRFGFEVTMYINNR